LKERGSIAGQPSLMMTNAINISLNAITAFTDRSLLTPTPAQLAR
jgi:hypothetical protein